MPTFGFFTSSLGRASKSWIIPLYFVRIHHGFFLDRGGICSGPSISCEGHCTAWFCLIGPGGIENPHEDIAVNNGLHGFGQQRHGEGKAGFVSMPLALTEMTGICGIPAFSRARG